MEQEAPADFYEELQLSVNADPDTIHRVYRLLAQRLHPDNMETGNAARFRAITEAYQTLSDPIRRAQYDAVHQSQRQERVRVAVAAADPDNGFAVEQQIRLTLLEVLYTRRRLEPRTPGLFILDIEQMIGRPREHLEFTVWYLIQKRFIERADNSVFVITAEGVEYVEQHSRGSARPRLAASW
jgi:curved DNA-binding protein CbpA